MHDVLYPFQIVCVIIPRSFCFYTFTILPGQESGRFCDYFDPCGGLFIFNHLVAFSKSLSIFLLFVGLLEGGDFVSEGWKKYFYHRQRKHS